MQSGGELGPRQVRHDTGDPAVHGLGEVQDPQSDGFWLVHGAVSSLTVTLGTDGSAPACFVRVVDGDEERPGPRRVLVRNEPVRPLVTALPQTGSEIEHAGVMVEGVRVRRYTRPRSRPRPAERWVQQIVRWIDRVGGRAPRTGSPSSA
ncbi:hypothetical protein JCM4814A_68130 [Streptomyces phaeofaciens JCM 4814]|uniref:Uncharacterized protein n=1 Tax=Streptomyces phaeofaciens TaxID=68254 RepID=A0A918LS06_9ACTN|nr:hypothetical protein GCM10010226_16780 [Streptomyces phaeofaciens]